MAAPRKYTDAQRAEIFRLFEQGLTSQEISERCGHGSTACESFRVPRRTVSDIARRMSKEHRLRFPTTPDDLDRLRSVERYPERVAQILGNELKRLETKQCRGPLSIADLELMQKAVSLSGPLAKRLEGQQPPAVRGHNRAPRGSPQPAESETFVEKLSREEREKEKEATRLASTRTHRQPENVQSEAASEVSTPPEPGERPDAIDPAPPGVPEPAPEYIPAPYEGPDPDPLYLRAYEQVMARREAAAGRCVALDSA